MSSARILALMALMNDTKRAQGAYWRAVTRAAQTFTGSTQNDAAIERGNAALLEIEGTVRQWVADHPEPAAADRAGAGDRCTCRAATHAQHHKTPVPGCPWCAADSVGHATVEQTTAAYTTTKGNQP